MPCLPTSLRLYEEIIKHCLCETDAAFRLSNSYVVFSGVLGGGDMETVLISTCNRSEISCEMMLIFICFCGFTIHALAQRNARKMVRY